MTRLGLLHPLVVFVRQNASYLPKHWQTCRTLSEANTSGRKGYLGRDYIILVMWHSYDNRGNERNYVCEDRPYRRKRRRRDQKDRPLTVCLKERGRNLVLMVSVRLIESRPVWKLAVRSRVACRVEGRQRANSDVAMKGKIGVACDAGGTRGVPNLPRGVSFLVLRAPSSATGRPLPPENLRMRPSVVLVGI